MGLRLRIRAMQDVGDGKHLRQASVASAKLSVFCIHADLRLKLKKGRFEESTADLRLAQESDLHKSGHANRKSPATGCPPPAAVVFSQAIPLP
jgi:hypothetical protein